jgi:uncharacterized ferritin-like protein (DUF455 family)
MLWYMPVSGEEKNQVQNGFKWYQTACKSYALELSRTMVKRFDANWLMIPYVNNDASLPLFHWCAEIIPVHRPV